VKSERQAGKFSETAGDGVGDEVVWPFAAVTQAKASSAMTMQRRETIVNWREKKLK